MEGNAVPSTTSANTCIDTTANTMLNTDTILAQLSASLQTAVPALATPDSSNHSGNNTINNTLNNNTVKVTSTLPDSNVKDHMINSSVYGNTRMTSSYHSIDTQTKLTRLTTLASDKIYLSDTVPDESDNLSSYRASQRATPEDLSSLRTLMPYRAKVG